VVVQNQNGSIEHIWNWVITPTEVTSKPVPYKVNPTTIELPPIPLNTSQPLTLIVSIDQWSTVTLKIDGQVYGTPRDVSTPNSDVIFTIGLDYLNNLDHKGEHTVAITAENSNGESDTALIYTFQLVCPYCVSGCIPSGDIIPWPVLQWRPNSASSWRSANHCNLNAAINFAYTGNPSQSDKNNLASYEWRKVDTCPGTCAQPVCVQKYVPDGGPKGLTVYHVKRIGPDSCPNIGDRGHAMLALYKGSVPPAHPDDQTWSNWEVFQYGKTNLQAGMADCDINAGGENMNQIPRPRIPNEVVTLQISYVSCIVADPVNGPSLQQGTTIVTFYVHSTGDPTISMQE
jgi:archaellum component FlaG (FlaF/FlaG flagellin family)